MRIGLDGSPLLQPYGGIGAYTRELLAALLAIGAGHEFVVYVPASLPAGRLPAGKDDKGRTTCITVGRMSFRWRGWLDDLDVFHGTNFKLQTRGRHGAVVTIHDCWLDRRPEYSKKLFGQRVSSIRTRRRAHRASRVIAISRFTAREIQELYGLPEERIRVVHHGVSGQFYPDQDREGFRGLATRLGLPEEPYVLFVGGADPRKNHEVLFRAYAGDPTLRSTCRLVAVGNPQHRLGSLQATARRLGISDRVTVAGPVSAPDLRLLYSQAAVFAFPSRYEGFGLPVLEAMACGAPVVTSNRTSLPEIAGEAAVLVSPDSEEELGDALRRVVQDTAAREGLRQKGLGRAKQFNWEQAARQTLDVYKEVCGLKG